MNYLGIWRGVLGLFGDLRGLSGVIGYLGFGDLAWIIQGYLGI